MPHRIQGGALGQVLFSTLQITQTKGNTSKSVKQGGFREDTGHKAYRMPPRTLHCQGHVPFRLLCRNLVRGCGGHHSRQPVKRRQRGTVAEIPPGEERAVEPCETVARSDRPYRQIP